MRGKHRKGGEVGCCPFFMPQKKSAFAVLLGLEVFISIYDSLLAKADYYCFLDTHEESVSK